MFIKKVSRNINEICEKASIANVGYKNMCENKKNYGEITLELIIKVNVINFSIF